MGEFVNISDLEDTLGTIFIEPITIEEPGLEADTCNDCVSQSYGE